MRSELPLALHLLRTLLAAVGGLCILVCVLAAVAVAADLASDADTWDGLIGGLGMLAIGFTAPVGVVAVVLMRLLATRPAAGAKVALVAGCGLALLPLVLNPAAGLTGSWLALAGLPMAFLATLGLAGLEGPTD